MDKNELLELLKNHLSISVDDEEYPPYYDQSGSIKVTVTLNWVEEGKNIKITTDSISISQSSR